MIRTRRTVAAVAVAGVVGAGLATTGIAGAATTLNAKLSGRIEVPKAGNGTGTAKLTLNAKTGRVCFTIKLKHVGVVMAGHIHQGAKGTAGPIVVPLFSTATRKPKGCVTADKAVVKAILRAPRSYYVNVHNAKFPAGAARGQLH
jgi:hypothetical protein